MSTARKPALSLYVDRGCPENWIVRDGDGRFWIVPPGEGTWEQRRPYQPTGDTALETIPGHYIHMLGFPTS